MNSKFLASQENKIKAKEEDKVKKAKEEELDKIAVRNCNMLSESINSRDGTYMNDHSYNPPLLCYKVILYPFNTQ